MDELEGPTEGMVSVVMPTTSRVRSVDVRPEDDGVVEEVLWEELFRFG